ncbi:hypothetical protein [Kordiimonas marina]|uniref:hypothetical protein n=1 Tax=Kordiimonas marina TaxID=2872312 RepID=UPI001FF680C9|nr:hypothetical protein [Kordiimonas marina]MCJ9428155.1 hypothetical protein [Kordiimonas marina]
MMKFEISGSMFPVNKLKNRASETSGHIIAQNFITTFPRDFIIGFASRLPAILLLISSDTGIGSEEGFESYMKLRTAAQKKRNTIRAQKLHRRAQAYKHWRRTENIRKYINPNYREGSRWRLRYEKYERQYLALPAQLSLSHNYEETVSFLHDFRKCIFEDRCPLQLDFTTLKHVSPGAALVLVAEIDRWRKLFKFRPKAVDLEKWDTKIRHLLKQMGFFNVLNVSNAPTDELSEVDAAPDGVISEFLEFTSSDKVVGELAISLRQKLEELAGEGMPERGGLYRSISEAMTNVLKHAYPDEIRNSVSCLPDRWWMSGSFRRDQRRMTVMFFDQGVGIAKTLPRRFGWEQIQGFLAKLGLTQDDASMIRAAMEMGRSQTGMPYRGKGLPDIRALIDKLGEGRLRIVSGAGHYQYTSETDVTLKNHSKSLGGTLIQWDFMI